MNDILKSLEDEIRFMKPDKKSDLSIEGGALVSKGDVLKILEIYKNNNDMNLQKKYEQETGKKATQWLIDNNSYATMYYTEDYGKWLESKIKAE